MTRTPARTSASARPLTRAERRRDERAQRPRGAARHAPGRRPFWRSPIVAISGLALVGGFVLIAVLGQGQPAVAEVVNPPLGSYPPGLASGTTLGRSDAPVTIEVWSDFQCPFCGRFARLYLPGLVRDFVSAGDVRIVAHDVAFVGHANPNESLDAAVAASCAADQGRYWDYHNILFGNQSGENEGAFRVERLQAMADAIGLDRAAWDRCRLDPARARAVQATTSTALAAGIDSTPTLVINGVTSKGVPSTYEAFAAQIRSLLPAGAASPSAPASLAAASTAP
jgi:protein-disulfide isomerase